MRLLLCGLARLLIALRYRVRVQGLDDVQAAGRGGILLLASHPALIDPAILLSRLYPRFRYRVLADTDRVAGPVLGPLADFFGAIRLPDAVRHGAGVRDGVAQALEECAEHLQQGGNVMLYPAGHLLRGCLEEIGANSAVETILRQAPSARVVLVRVRGLWGSMFSRAAGSHPDLIQGLRRALWLLFINGLFCMPRRRVDVRVWEPRDFPREGGRSAINTWLEQALNADPPSNTYVPYRFWERGGLRKLPEPARRAAAPDAPDITPTLRKIVYDQLEDMSGRGEMRPDRRLAADLGLDSLARLELVGWIEREFGFSVPNPDMLETVADVLAAASGQALADQAAWLRAVPRRWFKMAAAGRPAAAPAGDNIAAVFLAQAAVRPDAPVIADQNSGVRSYRDIITAILVLQPHLRRLPGERLGLMLPASTAATVLYLATLFAGKIPVMLNWTLGERNINYLADLLGLQSIVTARKLTEKLQSQGLAFGAAERKFVFLEDVADRISLPAKLWARCRSHCSWRQLAADVPDDPAVILFTSGSESFPKAVPLTHVNVLTNIRDITSIKALRDDDVMIAFLPPFHSFGLTLTVILPMLTGVRTVYHPNPTEGGSLAKMIALYGVTALPGTPTFLNGILKGALPEDLATLRLAVTGAEKCPERVYRVLRETCPGLQVLEGYGITECSPVVAVNRPEQPVPLSIGRIMPSLEFRIMDEALRKDCASGEQGVLLVRGPSVFGGYLKYDGPSPFVTVDGLAYYHTGDLVVRDAEGVFRPAQYSPGCPCGRDTAAGHGQNRLPCPDAV
ncbi:MAG: AMP-binding protein [Lentisphaerae bacterium]|nr:AMP-binding protein [Lentisphaerota bacterium]